MLINVNFPDVPHESVKGVNVTRQGHLDISNLFIDQRQDARGIPYFWIGERGAMGHMLQNGALLSSPRPGDSAFENRENIGKAFETCAICHGPGRIADLDVVHDK